MYKYIFCCALLCTTYLNGMGHETSTSTAAVASTNEPVSNNPVYKKEQTVLRQTTNSELFCTKLAQEANKMTSSLEKYSLGSLTDAQQHTLWKNYSDLDRECKDARTFLPDPLDTKYFYFHNQIYEKWHNANNVLNNAETYAKTIKAALQLSQDLKIRQLQSKMDQE